MGKVIFKLFTPYGGTMNLDIANNFDIESNGEVYLTDYAGNTASKMTVQAGSLSIDAAGLRADEIDIDVTGLLKIGEPEAVYSSGIYGGRKRSPFDRHHGGRRADVRHRRDCATEGRGE